MMAEKVNVSTRKAKWLKKVCDIFEAWIMESLSEGSSWSDIHAIMHCNCVVPVVSVYLLGSYGVFSLCLGLLPSTYDTSLLVIGDLVLSLVFKCTRRWLLAVERFASLFLHTRGPLFSSGNVSTGVSTFLRIVLLYKMYCQICIYFQLYFCIPDRYMAAVAIV